MWRSKIWGILCCALVAVSAHAESLEIRTLRTAFTGVPFATVEELTSKARDARTGSDWYALSRAALEMLEAPNPRPDEPLTTVFSKVLDDISPEKHAIVESSGLPAELKPNAILYTLAYVLTLKGEEEFLLKALTEKARLGVPYQQETAFNLIHIVDKDRGAAILNELSGEFADDYNLSSKLRNETTELYFPFITELAGYYRQLPASRRTRAHIFSLAKGECPVSNGILNNLLGLVGAGTFCDQPLGIFLLGFFPNEGAEAVQEIEVLRKLSNSSHYCTRHFALQSLGLRSKESLNFWISRIRSEESVWAQTLMTRILFSYYGNEMVSPALDLINSQIHGYVQWELMWDLIFTKRNLQTPDYWDLWFPNSLNYRMSVQETHLQSPKLKSGAALELLKLLELKGWRGEAGALQQLLYQVMPAIDEHNAKSFLRVLNQQADKKPFWWLFPQIREPIVKPYVEYWSRQAEESESKQTLEQALKSITENIEAAATNSCSEPTLSCLESTLRAESQKARDLSNPVLETEAQLVEWLKDNQTQGEQFKIEIRGPLEREALVTIGGETCHYEFIFDGWRGTPPGCSIRRRLNATVGGDGGGSF